MLLAFVMLLQGVFFYYNDYPLVRAMLGLSEESGKVLVGYVIKKEGTLQRQLAGDTGFKSIDIQTPVYNKDVIVSGPNSDALIQFQKGGGIRMGPSSMIRISFVTGLELGGIKRHTSVELVSGKVINQSSDDAVELKAQGKTFSLKANKTQGIEVKAGAPVRATEITPGAAGSLELIPQRDLMAMLEKVSEVPVKEAPKLAVAQPAPPPPPPPPPPPARLVRITAGPHFDDSEIFLTGEGSDAKYEKKLTMNFEVEPPTQGTQVAFWRLSENRKAISKEPILKEKTVARGSRRFLEWKGIPPGPYVWEILDEKGGRFPNATRNRGEIEVAKKLDVIQIAAPLIAGRRSYSNRIDREPIQNFEIKLEWKAVPGVKKYEVHFSKAPVPTERDPKVTTDTNEYIFSKNQILSGVRYYRVSATLENGYVVQSPMQKLTFQFLPPSLVVPEGGSVVSKRALLKEDQNRILFTWQKTNFTLAYEIEVAKDQEFQAVLIKKKLLDNYFVYTNPNTGQYFWRVRSISKDIASQMSPPQQFTVAP